MNPDPGPRITGRWKNPVAVRFGHNLCSRRKQIGISQAALARSASLHRQAIGMLERGERTPRIDTLVKLAGVLSIPPGYLLRGIDWTPQGVQAGRFKSLDEGDGPVK
jgi:transcriptional regulator with XRE-family HTH domain